MVRAWSRQGVPSKRPRASAPSVNTRTRSPCARQKAISCSHTSRIPTCTSRVMAGMPVSALCMIDACDHWNPSYASRVSEWASKWSTPKLPSRSPAAASAPYGVE